MRVFGLLGLVLALLIVGLLVRKQIGSASSPSIRAADAPATAEVRDQSQQTQQQFKQSLDAAMQPPRPVPDE